MKLTFSNREKRRKGELNAIRRQGDIPAVLYSHGATGKNIVVKGNEFKAILRGVKPGCLPTTVFTLEGEKKSRAILKDIQYAKTTYDVLHLDFEELTEDVRVNVKVPIQCVGVIDCVGIKLGGILRQVIRTLLVNCLPKDIPSCFEIDIRELDINQTKCLSDIAIPENVRPLADLDEVAVVIAKSKVT